VTMVVSHAILLLAFSDKRSSVALRHQARLSAMLPLRNMLTGILCLAHGGQVS
jgi:hypothetical protein